MTKQVGNTTVYKLFFKIFKLSHFLKIQVLKRHNPKPLRVGKQLEGDGAKIRPKVVQKVIFRRDELDKSCWKSNLNIF